MILTDDWFTSVSHTEGGAIVLLTVRKGLTQFFESGKLRVRVDIAWPYTAEPDGMPDEETARLIEDIEPKLRRIMEKDKLAILTGNYTGGGQKDWTFYTRHLPSFGERLNECLARRTLTGAITTRCWRSRPTTQTKTKRWSSSSAPPQRLPIASSSTSMAGRSAPLP